MPSLVFEFENEEALLNFKSWFCGAGEQKYWDWMKVVEMDEEGPVTGVDFDFWGDTTGLEGFNQSRVINVTCGRIDKGWA